MSSSSHVTRLQRDARTIRQVQAARSNLHRIQGAGLFGGNGVNVDLMHELRVLEGALKSLDAREGKSGRN